VPGDLTLTALAGTSLQEIADATLPHGQWLPFDAFGSTAGTLGATLATASCGPLASSIGAPRDVALGLAVVTGEGTLIRGGGRVVKNVAGFDLVRLNVGAWGTLGVLVEATVRLRARPIADETFALELPEEEAAVAALLRMIRQAPLTPLAGELLNAPLAAECGLDAAPTILMRVAGNAASVGAQRAALAALSRTTGVSPDIWQRLRSAEPRGCAVLRLSHRPSQLAALWRAVAERDTVRAHASLERGIVRCICTDGTRDEVAALRVAAPEGTVFIGERLTPAAWTLAGDVTSDELSRRVRNAFDPDYLLNRGILGEALA
jgi:glycolate oxidase FAD binding subunit